MDPDTQAHVDAARRPAHQAPMQSFSGDVLSEVDLPSDVLDPSVRLHEMREGRAKERLRGKLERLVPVGELAVEGETVATVIEDPRGELAVEEQESYTGPVYEIRSRCVSCHREMVLRSTVEPGLTARVAALGGLRRARGTFSCDECIERAEIAAERAEAAEHRRARLADSDLPAHMHEMYFNEMLPEGGRKYVAEKVREWSAAEQPAEPQICIWGAKGTGKTRLAATASWARLQRYPVKWVSLPVLLSRLGAAFNDAGRRQAISVLTGQGALVLDDIARDDIKVSDWAKTQLFTALDTRIQAGSPLLITTNMAPDRLEPLLGGSIMSRIAGMAVYELPGRDNRLSLPLPEAEAEAARHGLQDSELETNEGS